MALSGQNELQTNTQKIINAAAKKLGVLSSSEEMTDHDYRMIKEELNMMIKQWQIAYPFIWKYTLATLFLEKGKNEYKLGSDGDHATEEYYETTVKVAATSGSGSIDLDSVLNINDGDFIGIIQDDGSVLWTTVNGTPIGDTVTLTDNLSDDVSVGNKVVTYTNKITKPLQMINLQFVSSEGSDYKSEIQMSKFATRQEYFIQANKLSQGTPTQYYYQPRRNDTLLYIWQPSSENLKKIEFSYVPRFDINIRADEELDFPDEWFLTIVWNLALNVANNFGFTASSEVYQTIKAQADKSLVLLHEASREEGVVHLYSSYGEYV